MSAGEWDELAADTTTRMSEYVRPFVTPIGRMLSETEGMHEGTGSFIERKGERFLLSNDHVAAAMTSNQLTIGFHGTDDLVRVVGNAHAYGAPQDVALWRLSQENWTAVTHMAATIPESKFAPVHAPVSGEMLFLQGFAGERSKFLFGHLVTPRTPYLAIEAAVPEDPVANPTVHFALTYSPESTKSVDSSSRGPPDPHGLSGSLIWDTRRIACLRDGRPWHPEEARVTGILWGWLSGQGCLLATRVEHMPVRELASSFGT